MKMKKSIVTIVLTTIITAGAICMPLATPADAYYEGASKAEAYADLAGISVSEKSAQHTGMQTMTVDKEVQTAETENTAVEEEKKNENTKADKEVPVIKTEPQAADEPAAETEAYAPVAETEVLPEAEPQAVDEPETETETEKADVPVPGTENQPEPEEQAVAGPEPETEAVEAEAPVDETEMQPATEEETKAEEETEAETETEAADDTIYIDSNSVPEWRWHCYLVFRESDAGRMIESCPSCISMNGQSYYLSDYNMVTFYGDGEIVRNAYWDDVAAWAENSGGIVFNICYGDYYLVYYYLQ